MSGQERSGEGYRLVGALAAISWTLDSAKRMDGLDRARAFAAEGYQQAMRKGADPSCETAADWRLVAAAFATAFGL